VSREFVPVASRKRVAGEDFATMSNSDPTLFERLAKVEPAKLARLLVELAAQDQTILEQVQFLLASGGDCASCASATFSIDPTPSGWSATWAALRPKNAPQPKT
jgi:hypothetical protein